MNFTFARHSRGLPLALSLLGLVACGPGGGSTADACKGREAGDLVISEFLNDPNGVDTGKEYIELFNATGAPIELKGFTVFVSRLDGTSEKTHLIRAGTVPAGGYFTLGDVRGTALPSHIGYSYDSALGALPNSDGKLGLRCGALELDAVTYTGGGKPGHARTFDGDRVPDSESNDDESLWCDATVAFEGDMFGSPGDANASCTTVTLKETCDDNGTVRSVSRPIGGDLVISEVMANPAVVTDANGEWLEVYTLVDVDLNGVEVASGTSRTVLDSERCLHMPAGTYAVLARNADSTMNGGISNVLATTKVTLTNAGGMLTLKYGDELIDAASYGSATDGVATQLDVAQLDPLLNDVPEAFCPATELYGVNGNKGTPGAANVACPMMLPEGQCLDPNTSEPRTIVPPAVGDLVVTEFMADPTVVADSLGEWFEVLAKTPVDLNDVELLGASSGTKLSSNTCMPVAAGQLLLFARNADPAVNGGLPDLVTATFSFSLLQSNGTLQLRHDTTVVDEVSYTSSSSGISTQLDADKQDAVLNDDPANFCPTSAEKTYGGVDGGAGDRGTPASLNELCQ